jgi:hypothetical protein
MTVSPLASTKCHAASSTVICRWPMRGDTSSALGSQSDLDQLTERRPHGPVAQGTTMGCRLAEYGKMPLRLRGLDPP